MRLHKTRDHGTALSVDNNVSRHAGATDLRDAFVANQKICAHDSARLIHRDEGAVFDED
jgi:hypothetical protein